MKSPQRRSRSVRRNAHGFLLLEALLAIGVFAIAVTGFTMALSRTADLADQAQRRLAVTRLLRSALAERGIIIDEPVLSAASCLMVAARLPGIDPVELVPLYPREPDAVTLWRARHQAR